MLFWRSYAGGGRRVRMTPMKGLKAGPPFFVIS